jgi:hypothetical protein
MTTPKIPRFAIRNHDKSDQDKINFQYFSQWMDESGLEWTARTTVISEFGTDLGEKSYDTTYKVIFVNDPMVLMEIRLRFDFVHAWKDMRKHVHPMFRTTHMTEDYRDCPD